MAKGHFSDCVDRDRRSPSPRSACARATRTEGPMFLSEDAFDLDGDDAGCVHLLLFPPLPRHGLGRSRASFHRQRGTLGRGRFYLVPLTRAGACVSGGRACGVAEPASLDRHRLGGWTPRQRRRCTSPVVGGASRTRASTRYSDPSPETTFRGALLSLASLLLLFAENKKQTRLRSRRVAFGESRTRRKWSKRPLTVNDIESTRTSSAGGTTRTARRRAPRPACTRAGAFPAARGRAAPAAAPARAAALVPSRARARRTPATPAAATRGSRASPSRRGARCETCAATCAARIGPRLDSAPAGTSRPPASSGRSATATTVSARASRVPDRDPPSPCFRRRRRRVNWRLRGARSG